ncbi:MAG: hypothetical protein J6Y47_07745 [Bacteroidales bacterium]|nr:hypothetical protein [Bacteroidales bacterium]
MKMKKVLLLFSVLIYSVSPIQAQNIHTKIGDFPIGVMSGNNNRYNNNILGVNIPFLGQF